MDVPSGVAPLDMLAVILFSLFCNLHSMHVMLWVIVESILQGCFVDLEQLILPLICYLQPNNPRPLHLSSLFLLFIIFNPPLCQVYPPAPSPSCLVYLSLFSAPVIWVQFWMIIIYVVVFLSIVILLLALCIRFCCLGFCYVKQKKVVVDSTFYTSESTTCTHINTITNDVWVSGNECVSITDMHNITCLVL